MSAPWRGSSVLDARGRPVLHGAAARNAPGLYFTGFTNPISGMFRELANDAEKIAKAEARRAEKTRATRRDKGAFRGAGVR